LNRDRCLLVLVQAKLPFCHTEQHTIAFTDIDNFVKALSVKQVTSELEAELLGAYAAAIREFMLFVSTLIQRSKVGDVMVVWS